MTDKNDDIDWGPEIDAQFMRQASWTEMFRNQIYRRINLLGAKKILDVGCGTGVITREIREKCSAKISAIDNDPGMIRLAKKRVSKVDFIVENAEQLSAKSETFDIVLFHYLMLWLNNPELVVKEMARVCKKKGYVVALAEPDYGGWVEHPDFNLGKKHIEYLQREGADPCIGRKIQALFESAGLETEISIIAQAWDKESLRDNIEEEWRRVLEADLISEDEFKQKLQLEKESIAKNQRLIFIPVFTAIGRKK
ncbi:MAG: methyltransferase domain-containing protein [Candidatus Heimdallarchaeota archaeon]|nr:methyltransferase domain-containing protein [Candidatus Heimdallarchaeota archaeon]MCK4878135.1 methyltransferase domain-containing protein [Candidatus Heimdallarchaeota archaeon]